MLRSAPTLDNPVCDLKLVGEINSDSNNRPSEDERLLLNPLYAATSPVPGGEAPPGSTTHQMQNSFHLYDVVGFENQENKTVYAENTLNAHAVPIARAAGIADTGEYSTLDDNSHYSAHGPSTIPYPPGEEEREYSYLHHSHD